MRITDFFRPAAAAATADDAPVEEVSVKRQKQITTLCPCFLNHSYRCSKHSVFRTVLNRQLDPRLSGSPDNLTWQWLTCSKLSIEHTLHLDCGYLDNTMVPKRTATSLQFLPSNGELLLAANMDQVSIFNFDFYRLQATTSKAQNAQQIWTGVPSEVDFPFNGQPVESVQWNPWNEVEFCATFPSARLVRVLDIETGEEKFKQSIMGAGPVPTCTLFQDNNVLLVGTSVGGIRGFDLRSRRGILAFDHPSKYPVVGLLSNNKLVIAAFGNGDICEFSGTKQVQQAFAAKLPILNETKRVTNRVGISALCALSNSPFGDICVACVDGSIQRFNPLRFRFSVDSPIRGSESRVQDVQYYAPQPTTATTERANQPLINVKSCIGFGTQSRYLFSVKRFNENIVEVFDLHATTRRRLYYPQEEEEFHKIKTLEFKRNISAIAVHPDSDVLVCALQKSSMLEVRGLI